MKPAYRALHAITGTQWLMTHDALQTMLEIAQRKNAGPDAVAAELGRPLDNTHDVEIRNGTAIVNVIGPLFRYANLFTMLSGATSYDTLATDFKKVVDDPMVDNIVLNIDSPGGDARGLSEFADMIYAAREKKKIIAYVDGTSASAAYWISTAASEIVINDTAMLGSIGTVMTVKKAANPDELGDKTYEIVSKQSPYKRLDPDKKADRDRMQVWLDDLSAVFIQRVARNRGVDEDTVLEQYGQGDMMVGQRAIDAGLADRIGSFEGLLAELASGSQAGSRPAVGASAQQTEGNMPKPNEQAPATTASGQQQITADFLRENHADVVGSIEQAARDGYISQSDAQEQTTKAAADERDRIMGILSCDEAQGRQKSAVKLANKPGMSVEDAKDILADLPKEASASFENFDQEMSESNPDVEPDGTEDGDDEEAHLQKMNQMAAEHGIQ